MQLAAHEVHELNELAMSCYSTITNTAYYINQSQDIQLKSILEQHLALHCQMYNIKVDYLSNPNGTVQKVTVPQINQMLNSFTQTPVATYPPITPKTSVKALTDRDIATTYLFMIKRAGREYAWYTMEVANPNLRTFLEDAFKLSSHQAYEVWQWMVMQGYYPLEEAPQPTMNMLSQFYQQVPASQSVQ